MPYLSRSPRRHLPILMIIANLRRRPTRATRRHRQPSSPQAASCDADDGGGAETGPEGRPVARSTESGWQRGWAGTAGTATKRGHVAGDVNAGASKLRSIQDKAADFLAEALRQLLGSCPFAMPGE